VGCPATTVVDHYLARAERLDLVERLRGPRVIPAPVHDAVVETGLEQGDPDARRVERAVEAGDFEILAMEASPLADRLSETPNLSEADVAVLTQAATADGVAVMDETYGRDVAATEGIATRGSAYLVLQLLQRNAIEPGVARRMIDAMLDAGWYCSPDLYADILAAIDAATE